MLVCSKYNHKVSVPEDDGGPITFRWHFQRGLLEPRMSAYELAQFVLSHMPTLYTFFEGHKRVQAEFAAMLIMLATSPKEAIDEVLPWIKSVVREADADVIYMSLFDKTPQESKRKFFI